MSPAYQSGKFSAQSPTDLNVKDFKKRSKISYTRDRLLSLAGLGKSSLPEGLDSSITCASEDAPNLDSDLTNHRNFTEYLCENSVHDGILGEKDSFKVAGKSVREAQCKSDHFLHKSYEPYRPPHLYKKAMESKNSEACKSSTVGYSDGIQYLASEECNNRGPMFSQRDGGISGKVPGLSTSLEKGTGEELQSMAPLVSSSMRTDIESGLETYIYPSWMFGNGCQSLPGFTRDDSYTIPSSSSITRNPWVFDIGIEKGPNLNHSNGAAHEYDLGLELCLPDENSLLKFDETYLPDKGEKRIEYEDFTVSPDRSSIREKSSVSSLATNLEENLVELVPEDESPIQHYEVAKKVAEFVLSDETTSSPFDMAEMPVPAESQLENETPIMSLDFAENLVESVLADEPRSSPVDSNKLVGSIPYEPTPLHRGCSCPQFPHVQLSPRWDMFHFPSHGQVHGITQKKSLNTKTGPLRPPHLSQSSMISHPIHLDGEERRFEGQKGYPLLHPVPSRDIFPFPLQQRLQREASPRLPALPMTFYEREVSPLQNFNAYHQTNCWVSPMANPGVQAYD